MLKILTFNINSIKMRYHTILDIIQKDNPHIICLQEIKCTNDIFATYAFPNYKNVVNGEKAYNGVAILYKKSLPIQSIDNKNVFFNDHQARYVAIHLDKFSVASMYVPNGGDLKSPKYPYKKKWLQAWKKYALNHIQTPFCFCGDFNIIPYDIDAYQPEKWYTSPLGTLEIRNVFRSLLGSGYVDALRILHPHQIIYTFWDYTKGAFMKDFGLRIDHFLLSPPLSQYLQSTNVLRNIRNDTRPSDHAPVMLTLNIHVDETKS